MIVTDKFVFVHLPRSGGTFVSEVIRKFFPSAHEIGYHLPRSLLPKEYSHLPVLGGVRNPWEFYASWYHHQYADTKYSPLFCSLSENRKLDFVQTIRNALNLGVSDDKLDLLIQALPENFIFQKPFQKRKDIGFNPINLSLTFIWSKIRVVCPATADSGLIFC